MAVMALDEKVHRVVSSVLDQAFYRAVYPELNKPGFDAVRHYLEQGWREGRDPAPWFSVRSYLEINGDIAKAGIEPFYHYLSQGRLEAREVRPSELSGPYLADLDSRGAAPVWSFEPEAPPRRAKRQITAAAKPLIRSNPMDRKVVEPEFDAAFYVAEYPDVAAAGADPLGHFLAYGWREFRDPNAQFSVRDYLEAYPDIAAAGINPFVHYIQAGRAEGRSARNQLGFRYEILARGTPLAERIAAAAALAARTPADDPGALAAGLTRTRTGLKDLHVTFSHDDYTINTGGVQLCVQREDRLIADLNRDHLHLFPATPWPIVRTSEPAVLGLLLNGQRLGVFPASVIAAALGGAAPDAVGARSFALHSLLGHSVDEVLELLGVLGLKTGYFWLHDFASLCAGYHLVRNDVQDCAAPPPQSAACGICAYGRWRGRHLDEHEKLFAALDLTVASPSTPTLDLWRKSWSFPHRAALVHPHVTLAARGPAPTPSKGPLRIAYVGFAAPHKGWPVFRDLVARLADDRRYAFLHLGAHKVGNVAAEFHRVWVTEDEPRAMQQALERLEVDVVLNWPLCRETFSFAAYEAVAAGCAIVTWPDSGNVAAMVQDGDRGLVLPDEAALADAFESGAIQQLSRASRAPTLYDLKFSGLTVDLLSADGAAEATR